LGGDDNKVRQNAIAISMLQLRCKSRHPGDH
jgi:hypothetical protein